MESALWMCIAKPVFTLIRWNVVRWPCSKKHQADWFMRSEVAQLCTTLWDPIDCSLPDSSIHKILQARVLDWIAIYFSRGSFRPGIELRSPAHITDRCFTLWANRKACLIPWILKYFTKAFLEWRVEWAYVLLAGWMLQLSKFHRANDCFLMSYSNSRCTKTRLSQFPRCVNSFWGHKVFTRECWLLYLFLPWWG